MRVRFDLRLIPTHPTTPEGSPPTYTRLSMMRKPFASLGLFALPLALSAQAPMHSLPLKFTGKPTTPAITASDLMTRLYIFADDSMMGRAAGTIYHDKGTNYLAHEVARLGLKPGGDSGTFFQTIPLKRRDLASTVKLSI